ILDRLNIENETVRKSILSATITLIIGVLSYVLSILMQWIFLSLSKIKLEVNIKQNNRKKNKLTFTPNSNDEYVAEVVDLEIKMTPKGRLSNFLVNWLDINLEMFFNPNILDISLLEQWDRSSLNGFLIEERSIKVYILKNMKIQGERFVSTEHVMTEKIQIKPIRVKKERTNMDYCPTFGKGNFFSKKIARRFFEINYDQFIIECEDIHNG
ncbi:hypothetical protein HQ694_11930, partial [Enterococcus faecium]|nr:hypothetical protein [Enterococcus faecium]